MQISSSPLRRFFLDLSLRQRAILLIVVPLAFEIAFVVVLTGLFLRAEQDILAENHSKAVISEANNLVKLFHDTTFALVGYGVSRDQIMLDRYNSGTDQILQTLRSLEILSETDNTTSKEFRNLNVSTVRALHLLHQQKEELITSKGDFTLSHLQGTAKKELEKSMQSILDDIHALTEGERRVELMSPQVQSRSRNLIMTCLIAGVVTSVVVALLLAQYISRSMSDRLRVLIDNTKRLTQRQPLNPRIAGRDEISLLDTTFHDMADKLATVERQKRELVSMVSHDLRSPMMSIGISLATIADGKLGEVSTDIVEEIQSAEENTTRLMRLINDLLDMQRLEEGRMDVIKAPTSIASVISKAVRAVEYLGLQKQIVFTQRVDEYTVVGDEDRLVQVAVNLLANAVQHSETSATVEVKTRDLGDQVEVVVVDSGKGIPEEYQKRIFDRFQQVPQAKRDGSGLGLAICKAIIDAHKGAIGVTSSPGEGSSFWFRVPKAPENK